MSAWRAAAAATLGVGLSACQALAPGPGPAPRACSMAAFGAAPGLALPAAPKPSRSAGKSAPLQYAGSIRIGRGVDNFGDWADAGEGWKAWRVWLHEDEARSMAVLIEPFSLPPGAEVWLCASDGTARLGPYVGTGPGSLGKLWSPPVPGNELWIEALAPADHTGDVKLRIVEAQPAFR